MNSIHFSHQIQSEYYCGNQYVSIEEIVLDHFSGSNQASSHITSEAVSCQAEFCSFLSSNIKQDDATTAAHHKYIMEILHNRKVWITNKSTISYNIDGRAEQYKFATVLYLLSILSHAYNILIDCSVVAPEHGEYFVYGLNAAEIIFLTMSMKNVQLTVAATN